MSTYTVELRSQRAAIVREMGQVLSGNRADKMARWRELDDKQEKLRLDIETAERREHAQVPGIDLDNQIGSRAFMTAAEDSPLLRQLSAPDYRQGFDKWLRTGQPSPEMRALGDSSGQPGAYLAPIGFQREVETKLAYFGGVGNIARRIPTSTGAILDWPTMDDTENSAEWLTEGSPTNSADPTLGQVQLSSYLLSSKLVKVSVQLFQDNFTSIEGILTDAFGERLGRTLDTAYLVGDGSTIPVTGLLTALIAAGGREVLAVGSNANDGTGTDLNSVGTDDFSALINALNRSYQKPTNQFVMSQTVVNSLRKLKDKYGRPVWEVSLAQGEPDKIFGYGYTIDNAMANIGAGNISVLFGDFSKYVIRDVLGMTVVRFNEAYMNTYQIGYQAFLRTDAKLLQSAAFAYLQHPLS